MTESRSPEPAEHDPRAPEPVPDDAGVLARIAAAVREAHARSVPF